MQFTCIFLKYKTVIFQKTSKTTRLWIQRSTSACYSSDLKNVKIINKYFYHCSCGTLKVRIKKRHFLAGVEFSQPCCAAFVDLPCWVTPVSVHQFGHLYCFEWSVHVVCHLRCLSIFWFQFHIPDTQQGIYFLVIHLLYIWFEHRLSVKEQWRICASVLQIKLLCPFLF